MSAHSNSITDSPKHIQSMGKGSTVQSIVAKYQDLFSGTQEASKENVNAAEMARHETNSGFRNNTVRQHVLQTSK